jgi:hypothetical protein
MADQEDHRAEHRARTLKGGRIVFNGGYGVAECTIRNMSSHGAQLDVSNPMAVPSEFTLLVNPDRRGRPCRIIWRAGNRMGVVFTGPPEGDGPHKHGPTKRRDEQY